MSRNTDQNRKKYKVKLQKEQNKIQKASEIRKEKLKRISQQFRTAQNEGFIN